MKEITVIRHAKSNWGEAFLQDADRHLSERGLRDAYFMSDWYAKNNSKPDLLLSSTATRAFATAMIFARQLEQPIEKIKLEPKIYEASMNKLVEVIHAQDKELNSILLFGHNPGLTNLCNEFSKDIYFDNLPTCAIVSYQFNIKSWKDLKPGNGKLKYYEFPKNFKTSPNT